MKKIILGMAAFLVSSAPAFAGQVSTTLSLSADVSAVCTVSSTPVVFTGFTGAATVYASGDVTIQCSNGVTYSVGLDAGQNLGSGPDGALRALADGSGNFLNYIMYSSIFPAVEWGDAGVGSTYSKSNIGVNSDGNPKVIGANGELLSDLNAVPGSYADTINVIVQF